MEHEETLTELFRSPNRRLCAEYALVLKAVDIPHEISHENGEYVLLVEVDRFAEATQELGSYVQENKDFVVSIQEDTPTYAGLPGVFAYIAVLLAVWFASNQDLGGVNWYQYGRLQAGLVSDGEWWRTITALTLHADLGHLASNLGFGALFGYFAGQFLGSGFAWFVILTAAAFGNRVNAWVHTDAHTSVGASTAVFAALGLLSAAAWIRRKRLDPRWSYQLAPLFGGFLLLTYTGIGGVRTDVGAHIAGFGCGILGGVLYGYLETRIDLTRLNQRFFGTLTIALLALAWLVALP